MLFFESLERSLPFFKALASDVRIKILNILATEKEVNLNTLAQQLSITNGALTTHIRLLENAGLIDIKTIAAKHGTQKLCSTRQEKYLIHIGEYFEPYFYNVEIAPGQYIDYEVTPTCGIATSEKIIGIYDAPRFFSDVEHFKAQIAYFTTGYLEYDIPNYIPYHLEIKEIIFSAELGSEAPRYCNDYKSDIHFSINNTPIGVWQSPGDFGGERGVYNPNWWVPSLNQYGTVMTMRINEEGTFFDNKKAGDLTIGDLKIKSGDKIRLRLAVPEGLPNSRGLTIYGRGFGNHNSGMVLRISYRDPVLPEKEQYGQQ
jgi:predicted transcriptional regulator